MPICAVLANNIAPKFTATVELFTLANQDNYCYVFPILFVPRYISDRYYPIKRDQHMIQAQLTMQNKHSFNWDSKFLFGMKLKQGELSPLQQFFFACGWYLLPQRSSDWFHFNEQIHTVCWFEPQLLTIQPSKRFTAPLNTHTYTAMKCNERIIGMNSEWHCRHIGRYVNMFCFVLFFYIVSKKKNDITCICCALYFARIRQIFEVSVSILLMLLFTIIAV